MGRMVCALCELKLPRNPVVVEGKSFCCHGCQAVFSILQAKGTAANYRDDSTFLEAARCGLISNPALLEKVQEEKRQMVRLEFVVEQMWCPSCADLMRMVVERLPGVSQCVVDYATDVAVVEFDPQAISREKIWQRVRLLGYVPKELGVRSGQAASFFVRLGVAAFSALNLMMFSYPVYANLWRDDPEQYALVSGWVCLLLVLPAVLFSGWPIFYRWWQGMVHGRLGMEALVGLGVSAAFGLSVHNLWLGRPEVYFDSVALIITLVLIGKWVESKAKRSVSNVLMRVERVLPKRVRRKGGEFALLKEVGVGDLIEVRVGEVVPVDGVVVEGQGACDESVMTGEAAPVRKELGGGVVGGSLLHQGWLVVRVSAVAEASLLGSVVRGVRSSLTEAKRRAQIIDRVCMVFVPLVVGIAIAVGWLTNVERAIAVLLIACPCAIGIAVPLKESLLRVAIVRLGAIVRNGEALGYLGQESVYLFDKTGTVTQGRFRLLSGLEAIKDQAALKGIALRSTHPIAVALTQVLGGEGRMVGEIVEIPGLGLRGEDIALGSGRLMQELGLELPDSKGEGTWVYFAHKGAVYPICLGDCLRDDAAQMVESLGVACWLVSGDREEVVAEVGKACGFERWYSEKKPLEKREVVVALQERGETVCMVGDGINDAPALSAAHVGISVLAATDLSSQVSDIVLTTEELMVLPKLRQLVRKGRKIGAQNLFWAFFYNGLGIPLAAAGLLHPLFAAGAMVLSSTCIVLNSFRITNTRSSSQVGMGGTACRESEQHQNGRQSLCARKKPAG